MVEIDAGRRSGREFRRDVDLGQDFGKRATSRIEKMTELLYLEDAYLQACEATVTDVDADGRFVALTITKTESKGKGNKRVRIALSD